MTPISSGIMPDANSYYSLKLTADRNNWQEIVASVQGQWKIFFPGNPFEYFFLDEHFAEQYKADTQFGQTFGLFAGLAIFVSCLGLLGLASFVTNQRTKEIGIRKIVGANLSRVYSCSYKRFHPPRIDLLPHRRPPNLVPAEEMARELCLPDHHRPLDVHPAHLLILLIALADRQPPKP